MMQAWVDWWEEFGDDDGDGIRNGIDNDRDGNGQNDNEETEIPCPWDDINGNTVITRSINCDYIYAYICNGDYRYWYLGDYFDASDIDQKRELLISNLINTYPYLTTYFTRDQIKTLAMGCDMFSPDFNKCVLLTLMEQKQSTINQYNDYDEYVQNWEHFNYGTYLEYFYNKYGAEKYFVLIQAYHFYKNLNLQIEWEELVNGLDEYLSLSDPNNIDDGEGNINNEITVSGITPLILPLSGVNIGGSPARGNTEDLLFGDGGDNGVLNGGMQDISYFTDMRELFAVMTIGSTYTTGQEYIDQFQVNQSVDFNMVKMPLIQKVSNTGALKDYLKLFGDELKKRLKVIGGNNQQNIGIIDMAQTRPKFSSYGLKILLNDTEQTEILLIDYNYNSTLKQFDADVFIEITDHFGMDKKDVLKFQWFNPGFAAWWRLQHMAGYKPFRTKLYLKAKITGIL